MALKLRLDLYFYVVETKSIYLWHGSFIWVSSLAAFVLWCQNWVIATEATWPSRSKIFTIWPLTGKVCQLLGQSTFFFFHFFFKVLLNIEFHGAALWWGRLTAPLSFAKKPPSAFPLWHWAQSHDLLWLMGVDETVEAWTGVAPYSLISCFSAHCLVNQHRPACWTISHVKQSHSSTGQPRLARRQWSQDQDSCLADPQLTTDTCVSPAKTTQTQPDELSPNTQEPCHWSVVVGLLHATILATEN